MASSPVSAAEASPVSAAAASASASAVAPPMIQAQTIGEVSGSTTRRSSGTKRRRRHLRRPAAVAAAAAPPAPTADAQLVYAELLAAIQALRTEVLAATNHLHACRVEMLAVVAAVNDFCFLLRLLLGARGRK